MAETTTSVVSDLKNNQNGSSLDNSNDNVFRNSIALSSTDEVVARFNNYELEEDQWVDIEPIVAPERAYLKKYAYGEYLAHNLAYKASNVLLDPATQPLKVLEEDGTYGDYKCVKLKVNNPGLVGYILTPINLIPGKTPELKVMFRGTACKHSVIRDLEPGGAGASSFQKNQKAIMQQISDAIGEFNLTHSSASKPNIPINLAIAGHSLGGADSQNCLIGIMAGISQNHGLDLHTSQANAALEQNISARFNSIKNLRMFNYNSAGITLEANQNSLKLAKFMAEKRQEGKAVANIETYNLLVRGDGVQQTGEGHVLHNVTVDCAKVDVLKVNAGYGHRKFNLKTSCAAGLLSRVVLGLPGAALATTASVAYSATSGLAGTIGAHTSSFFDESKPVEFKYESLNNDDALGQEKVAKALSNKSWALNQVHKAAVSALNTAQKTVASASGFLTGLFFSSSSKTENATSTQPAMAANQVGFSHHKAAALGQGY